MSMQYIVFFFSKIENFRMKIDNIFNMFAQKIDCGTIFGSKIRKKRFTLVHPRFTI